VDAGQRVIIEGVLASAEKDGEFLVHVHGSAYTVPVAASAVREAPTRSYRERDEDLDEGATTDAFARRLRELRHGANLSQRQLAERIGVAQSAVWQWEHGKMHPSLYNIIGLIDALNSSPNELLGGLA
jgi:DNA-binding XRE family transcriptional regulator